MEISKRYSQQVIPKICVREETPVLYVQVFEDGISIEIPRSIVSEFFQALAKIIRPKNIHLHYRKNGKEISKSCSSDNLTPTLRNLGVTPLDPQFIAELGEVHFFTGGEGCISLAGEIPREKQLQLIQFILTKMGLPYQLPKKRIHQVSVRDGRVAIQ